MAPDEFVTKRLAFIKYLYASAVEQSRRPDPLCSASILMFHDAIELFLQLGYEYLGASKKSQSFMDYWDIISEKLPAGVALSQKASMERLNKSRVGLKHAGILPSKTDLEGFVRVTASFFEENTKLVFGINFLEISLIELVECVNAKIDLNQAQKLLEDNKIEEALDNVALSFAKLLSDYKSGLRDKFGHYPFSFSGINSLICAVTSDNSDFGDEVSSFSDDVESTLSDIDDSVSELQNVIEIIILRIDYRRYVKFNLLTPKVRKQHMRKDVTEPIVNNPKWTYKIQRAAPGSRGIPTIDDVQFCIDFVIESAMTLQDFTF